MTKTHKCTECAATPPKRKRKSKTKRAAGASAAYYAANPLARSRKIAYQREWNKRPGQSEYRSQLNQERRRRGIYGRGGPDVSHTTSGRTTLEDPSSNRARNGAGGKPRLRRDADDGKKYTKVITNPETGRKTRVRYGAEGYRIAPGTPKGNRYCARSFGDMKSHGKDCSGPDRNTPLCLSRTKWRCSGKSSRRKDASQDAARRRVIAQRRSRQRN